MKSVHSTTRMSRRAWVRAVGTTVLAGALAMSVFGSANAQEWPTQPVKIVLAIGPGSSGDTLGRLLAPELAKIWKQSVIVENRPGAGGVVGTEHVVRVTDGHTILLGSQSSIVPKFTQPNLRYDPFVDLIPVRQLVEYQFVLATNAPTAQQVKTLGGLIDYSRNGEGVFFSGTGPTSIFNVSFGILNETLGMKYTSLDFNSITDMNLALVRNDAQVVVNNPASLKGFFEKGDAVPLAVISEKRYANMPDVPTLKESVGYSAYIPTLWAGFFMPKGTPKEVVDKVSRDTTEVFKDEAFRKKVESVLTASVADSNPEKFADYLQRERKIWEAQFAKSKK